MKKNLNDDAVNNEKKNTDKPLYSKPKLIKLGDEMKWSRGDSCSAIE